MLDSKDDIRSNLAPYIIDLEACWRDALRDYTDKYTKVRHVHSKRSQASLIHDHMVDQLIARFGTMKDAEGDVAVYRKGNLAQLIYKQGRYKIRLKKLGKKLLTRNIPTQAVLNFVWQQQSFEQIPPPTNLFLGYRIENEAALSEATIWVTCPDGNRIAWSWELHSSELEQAKPAEFAEVTQLEPKAAPEKKRVRTKKPIASESKKEASGGRGSDNAKHPKT